jgi:hypothetical protein
MLINALKHITSLKARKSLEKIGAAAAVYIKAKRL